MDLKKFVESLNPSEKMELQEILCKDKEILQDLKEAIIVAEGALIRINRNASSAHIKLFKKIVAELKAKYHHLEENEARPHG